MATKPEATNSAATDDVAYILEFESAPGTNGLIRLVNWHHGRGVLDRRAVADVRPDLCDAVTFEMKAGWDVLGEIAKYWADRGAKVTKTTAAKAAAYRITLETGEIKLEPAAAPTGDVEMIKVSDLAKELGLKSKDVLEKLSEAGIPAKAHNSKVDEAAAREAISPKPVDPVPDEPTDPEKTLAPHEQAGG